MSQITSFRAIHHIQRWFRNEKPRMRKKTPNSFLVCLFIVAVLLPARAEETIPITDYRKLAIDIGGPNEDWSPAIQKALDENRGIIFVPAGTYKIRTTIRLSSSRTLTGKGGSVADGSVLLWETDDGSPAFDSDPNDYVSHFLMRGILIRTLHPPGTKGIGNCFELYGVTNNTAFHRVQVMNFKGDAWSIKRRKIGDDPTACGNVYFNQCFVISCGGYAFSVDGHVTALWNMCDINSCSGGAFYFKNGRNNQANITINSLWWEGTRKWASTQPILMEDMNGQPMTLIGCNFSGPSKGRDVVKIQGKSGANVVLINCSGFSFNNWINDAVSGNTLKYSSIGNTFFGQAVISDVQPIFEIRDSDGVPNQRTWRFSPAGNQLILSSRNDDSSQRKELMRLNANSGVVTFPNGIGMGQTVQTDSMGKVIGKFPVFDKEGKPLGYVPIYAD